MSGELLEVSTYYPNGGRENLWNNVQPGVGAVPLEPMGFTGKEADEEIGVTYFGERWLIPRLGRWATPDPLHVHAAGGGEALNSYHYVSGNLLQAVDPLGLVEVVATPAPEGAEADSYGVQLVDTNGQSTRFDRPDVCGESITAACISAIRELADSHGYERMTVWIGAVHDPASWLNRFGTGDGDGGGTGIGGGSGTCHGVICGSAGGDAIDPSQQAQTLLDAIHALIDMTGGGDEDGRSGGVGGGANPQAAGGGVAQAGMIIGELLLGQMQRARALARRWARRVTGGSSEALGNSMTRHGIHPLSDAVHQAHHIVPSEMADHAVVRRAGMQLDHPSNGVWLPVDEEEALRLGLPSHDGYHEAYNRALGRALDRAYSPNMTRQQAQRAIGRIQENAIFGFQHIGDLYANASEEAWYRLLIQ